MKKKWQMFLAAACLTMGVFFFPGSVSAEINQAGTETSLQQGSFPTGRVEEKSIEVEYEETEDADFYDSAELTGQQTVGQLKASAIYNSEWDKYKTWYFYNQFTKNEKEFYDALGVMGEELLRTTKSVEPWQLQDGTYYVTDFITSSKLTETQMEDILFIFRISNPQYYFFNNMVVSTKSTVSKYYAMGIYPAFADGSRRMTATAAVKAQADIWEGQAEQLSSEAERAKLLGDLIIDKVDYNTDIYSVDFDEDKAYSQSAYSVFCTDKTVCAGYSQAYAMMCNAVGVDAVAVTSTAHEWNKVRINDSWYNVDLTWADGVTGRYQFFWRSDAYYDTETAGGSYIQHREESLWDGLLPLCTLDTVQSAGYTTPGILPVISQTTEAPKAKVSMSGNTYKISLKTVTPGAEIYYTLDGSLPSPASTKSSRYTGVIKTGTTPKLRFVAVCDGMWDSPGQKAAIVTYYGNHAGSGSMQPVIAGAGETVKILANSYKRSGNTFCGWNTKADGTGVSYSVGQSVTLTGNLNLYAQWFSGKYKITYELNGGKNNSKNPTGYTPGKKITLKNPVRAGYAFVGWYTNKKLTRKFTQITSGTKGTLTLYAKWKPVKYKITYQLNGGKNNRKNPNTYTVTTKTIKLKKPERKGYRFLGWYSNKKYTKKVTQIKKGSTGNLILYAKWKKA